jgi:HK97 family phage portal protein
MTFSDRIRAAGRALVGKYTYGPNDLWLRGYTTTDVAIGRTEGHVTAAYDSCAIAYACIDRMAKDAAGVPLCFLRDAGDYESAVPDTDPVAQLFRRPVAGFTSRRLIGWSVMMRQLRGEVFWLLGKSADGRQSILPYYDPRYWREHVNREQGLYAWEYRQADNAFTVPAGEVMWLGQDNPANPYRGISPLKAAARALSVDAYGDALQADMLRRGGERGLVLGTDAMLSDDQYDQLLAHLAARRPGDGQSSRDFVLEGGLQLMNPDFTKEDVDILAMQNAAKDKICHVYGMAPVLIGDDDAAQYKSAPEAIKMYWQQTLVPLLHAFEDAFDDFFVRRLGYKTYVRFDLSRVSALAEDIAQLADVAGKFYMLGLSVEAINDRLGLGFSDDAVSYADYYESPAVEQQGGEAAAKSAHPGGGERLTNAVIKARANDPRFRVQRQRRLAKLERSTWNSVKAAGQSYREDIVRVAREAFTLYGVTGRAVREIAAQLAEVGRNLGGDLAEAVAPAHAESAQIGVASIDELVDGKHLAWHDRVKLIRFTPDTDAAIAARQNWLRGKTGPGWVDELVDHVSRAVEAAVDDAEGSGPVVQSIRNKWSDITTSRALTIARTEVGTIYNTARVEEMSAQDFSRHEWLTSIDESTRETHADQDGQVVRIGSQFRNGLEHPQQSGGPAEEVINCRCETIPVVED